jgi:proline dehydrogenase
MLRSLLLFLSNAQWARRLISYFGFARRTAYRFVAGETAAEAMAAVQRLNARGINATLDHLGESVTDAAAAERAAAEYVAVLGRIQDCGARSNVSLKLTQMGLDLSPELCLRNVRRIVERARALNIFVRIDMEGTPHTEATLAVFTTLHREYDQVGIVLQSYLYRTEHDLEAVLAEKARVRLCKGAYQEPPDKAYPRKADVDANFVKLAQRLLDNARLCPPANAAGRVPPLPAIATHDEKMIEAVKAYAAEKGVPREYFEFQMLYGIRRDLQEKLASEGYAVRVYVPYGTEWYPYFMRRLAKRPANVWFFLSNLVRR